MQRGLLCKALTILLICALFLAGFGSGLPAPRALAQSGAGPSTPEVDEEIEATWVPDYLHLATGDPDLSEGHGVYAWPFALDSIGWSLPSYQNYGGTPYFHHGMDMMKLYGTMVFNRSGGQVINIENYQPGWDLYWEVAVLDPDGYIWQYHHIEMGTIPQYIWDKWDEYKADPINGGFILPDTHVGNIIYWPVDDFHHIHLNILAAGGYYVNGFAFHEPLPDQDAPEVQNIGLLKNGQIYPGNTVTGAYSLYVHARDLILDHIHGYYLPPWDIRFSIDGEPVQTTWQFNHLPGADRWQYLEDYYVYPTCGDYGCRDYYIDLGFIPDSQYLFPTSSGTHTVEVTVLDYAGNSDSQTWTYTVLNGTPAETTVWQDDFETDLGWIANPDGTDPATSGTWERGNPEGTYASGPKQLDVSPSPVNSLVTGALENGAANSNDLDGGLTTIRSPQIALPLADSLSLSFRYYLAHGSDSSTNDYLRVKIIGATTSTVSEELGAANNDNGVWAQKIVDLSAFEGQTVYIQIEAADASGESLVEAGIDNLVIQGVNVSLAPIALPQSVTTPEDTPLDILLAGYDPNGDPLTFAIETTPTHGTLSGTPPEVTYTPAGDYFGPDSFTFTVDDGSAVSDPATVSIEVTPVNDPPVAEPQAVTGAEDTPLDILLTGSDPDGDPLTFTLETTPAHGILTGIAPQVTYLPAANYGGPDSFTFSVSDGQAVSEPAEVSIAVTPVNDPPVADPQIITVLHDTPISITLSAVDIDGDVLTYTLVTTPAHGALSGLAPDLVYTPEAGYSGPDGFTFMAYDGEAASEPAEVSLAVQPYLVELSGVVRDNATSEPIESALVWLDTGLATFTNPDGSYALEVEPGVYTLTASASGYVTATITALEILTGTVQDFWLVPQDCSVPVLENVAFTVDGLSVTFSSEVTSTYPVEYLWDFGDGITSTLATPEHTYALRGIYSVSLQVASGCGMVSWNGEVALGSQIYLPVIVRP